MAPLLAAYGALEGTDGVFNFAISEGLTNWQTTHSVWSLYTPTEMGAFPAAALMYRRGYVAEGPVVLAENARLGDLYHFKGTAVTAGANLDDFRKMDVAGPASETDPDAAVFDPLSFYVGRVCRWPSETGGESSAMDISPYVDREGKTVRSATGELCWDYGKGLVTIDAPCAQGAVGFLAAAGEVELGDVTIENPLEYGAIVVASLDGKSLAVSDRIIVQVMTEDKNYGWTTVTETVKDKNDKEWTCKRITSLGEPPIVVRDAAGAVTVRRIDAGELSTTALDFNGLPRKTLPPGEGDTLRIELLPDCIYYLVARSAE
jgi:hypothetical protein